MLDSPLPLRIPLAPDHAPLPFVGENWTPSAPTASLHDAVTHLKGMFIKLCSPDIEACTAYADRVLAAPEGLQKLQEVLFIALHVDPDPDKTIVTALTMFILASLLRLRPEARERLRAESARLEASSPSPPLARLAADAAGRYPSSRMIRASSILLRAQLSTVTDPTSPPPTFAEVYRELDVVCASDFANDDLNLPIVRATHAVAAADLAATQSALSLVMLLESLALTLGVAEAADRERTPGLVLRRMSELLESTGFALSNQGFAPSARNPPISNKDLVLPTVLTAGLKLLFVDENKVLSAQPGAQGDPAVSVIARALKYAGTVPASAQPPATYWTCADQIPGNVLLASLLHLKGQDIEHLYLRYALIVPGLQRIMNDVHRGDQSIVEVAGSVIKAVFERGFSEVAHNPVKELLVLELLTAPAWRFKCIAAGTGPLPPPKIPGILLPLIAFLLGPSNAAELDSTNAAILARNARNAVHLACSILFHFTQPAVEPQAIMSASEILWHLKDTELVLPCIHWTGQAERIYFSARLKMLPAFLVRIVELPRSHAPLAEEERRRMLYLGDATVLPATAAYFFDKGLQHLTSCDRDDTLLTTQFCTAQNMSKLFTLLDFFSTPSDATARESFNGLHRRVVLPTLRALKHLVHTSTSSNIEKECKTALSQEIIKDSTPPSFNRAHTLLRALEYVNDNRDAVECVTTLLWQAEVAGHCNRQQRMPLVSSFVVDSLNSIAGALHRNTILPVLNWRDGQLINVHPYTVDLPATGPASLSGHAAACVAATLTLWQGAGADAQALPVEAASVLLWLLGELCRLTYHDSELQPADAAQDICCYAAQSQPGLASAIPTILYRLGFEDSPAAVHDHHLNRPDSLTTRIHALGLLAYLVSVTNKDIERSHMGDEQTRVAATLTIERKKNALLSIERPLALHVLNPVFAAWHSGVLVWKVLSILEKLASSGHPNLAAPISNAIAILTVMVKHCEEYWGRGEEEEGLLDSQTGGTANQALKALIAEEYGGGLSGGALLVSTLSHVFPARDAVVAAAFREVHVQVVTNSAYLLRMLLWTPGLVEGGAEGIILKLVAHPPTAHNLLTGGGAHPPPITTRGTIWPFSSSAAPAADPAPRPAPASTLSSEQAKKLLPDLVLCMADLARVSTEQDGPSPHASLPLATLVETIMRLLDTVLGHCPPLYEEWISSNPAFRICYKVLTVALIHFPTNSATVRYASHASTRIFCLTRSHKGATVRGTCLVEKFVGPVAEALKAQLLLHPHSVSQQHAILCAAQCLRAVSGFGEEHIADCNKLYPCYSLQSATNWLLIAPEAWATKAESFFQGGNALAALVSALTAAIAAKPEQQQQVAGLLAALREKQQALTVAHFNRSGFLARALNTTDQQQPSTNLPTLELAALTAAHQDLLLHSRLPRLAAEIHQCFFFLARSQSSTHAVPLLIAAGALQPVVSALHALDNAASNQEAVRAGAKLVALLLALGDEDTVRAAVNSAGGVAKVLPAAGRNTVFSVSESE